MKNKIWIRVFDSTLRDGQQCPGAWMSFEKNIEYADLAANLWIDVLEAWFPSASKLDFEIVNTIAKKYWSKESKMMICGLCQLRQEQVDITIKALMPAVKNWKAVLHVYLPVDPELLKASLWSKSEDKKGLVDLLYKVVKQSVDLWMEVEFSPEGYSRIWENFDFTTDLIVSAVKAWVTTINCPDTIWWACMFEGESYYLNNIVKHYDIINKKFPWNTIIWSCHNHNDLWLAVSNTINSIFNGPVRQIEVCVNWIWERAWNASLEQCAVIINKFADQEQWHFYTNINTKYLKKVSDFVSENMLIRQPHSPITWDNSAKHTSWGHTNAILKHPLSYQPFDPSDVWNQITFVFGPLSWWNHAKNIINEKWYLCEESEKTLIAQFIKDMFSERRKGITDDELLEWYFEYRKPIKIEKFDYSKSSNCSSIKLKGSLFSLEWSIESIHQGKDSALAALNKIINEQYETVSIQDYKSKSEGKWINAKSNSVIMIIDLNWVHFEWVWIDEDIEISAMKALIDAVNKSYIEKNYKLR